MLGCLTNNSASILRLPLLCWPAHLRMRPVSRGNSRRATWVGSVVLQLFATHGDSPSKSTGVGCHALLQGIFSTQELNPGLPHCRATSLPLFTFMHWRRKWQPTPVFLPGESQGQGSLEGCRLWGSTESDMTLESFLKSDSIGFKVLPIDLAFTTHVFSGLGVNADN